MQAAYILTGYNDLSLSLVNPPSFGHSPNFLTSLMEKYVDTTQFENDLDGKEDDGPTIAAAHESAICSPVGLEGSSLLSQIPWLTPWADLFEACEPVKV